MFVSLSVGHCVGNLCMMVDIECQIQLGREICRLEPYNLSKKKAVSRFVCGRVAWDFASWNNDAVEILLELCAGNTAPAIDENRT